MVFPADRWPDLACAPTSNKDAGFVDPPRTVRMAHFRTDPLVQHWPYRSTQRAIVE